MSAAQIGELIGAFLAAGGVAYIWIGIMMLVRVRKRWPKFTYWSAAALAALVGYFTYVGSGSMTVMIAALLAAAFVIYRARKELFGAQPAAS